MSDQKLIIGYYRLSMEDDSEGESNSIINQRKLVKDYISNIPELVAMPFQEFYDDGYSGSSMERPAIKQVLELARENKVQCIVCLLYTSDAADEEDSVDVGGRRIIKKKTKEKRTREGIEEKLVDAGQRSREREEEVKIS